MDTISDGGTRNVYRYFCGYSQPCINAIFLLVPPGIVSKSVGLIMQLLFLTIFQAPDSFSFNSLLHLNEPWSFRISTLDLIPSS